MVLNYFDVHDPYIPPDPYLHRYTTMKKPGGHVWEAFEYYGKLSPQERQGMVDAYDGGIQYVDDQIADLFRQLQKRKLSDNTLVIITSDHGESFGEHGFMNHGNALYRELIHVPLIFVEPGRVPAGRKISQPVSLTSIPATLAGWAELEQRNFPGDSLAGLWQSPQSHPKLPAAYSELAQLPYTPQFPNFYAPMISLTTEQWHYISGGKFGSELFRCCDNAVERDNLSNTPTGRPVREQMAQRMVLLASESRLPAATPPSVASALSRAKGNR